MNNHKKTLDASYFNALYGNNQDPWNFEGSDYEKNKYAQTMLMIPDDVYARVFEIGCSNGVLTEMLQNRSQRLLAVDSSRVAVENAKKRLEKYHHVIVVEMEVPREFPALKFNLILLSEVGYFMVAEELLALRDKLIAALLPGGHLLMVHWTPVVEEFPLTGDQVHEFFIEESDESGPLDHLKNRKEPEYRMDLFKRKPVPA
ncbi:methyltransferase [Dyadobacter beijingensis]|uniref:Methyltransferase n=1 Tax=Dyadobacter beijingensis TaxID=365489 RepID=A0ABQ2HW23_9BACT|nr:SAM-dependent methyltransferase [Dyadobacter beijingensis]GGM89894.1 methyltransferase [Dyadobacter beijingensis]